MIWMYMNRNGKARQQKHIKLLNKWIRHKILNAKMPKFHFKFRNGIKKNNQKNPQKK